MAIVATERTFGDDWRWRGMSVARGREKAAVLEEVLGPEVEVRCFATKKEWADAHHGIVTASLAAEALGLLEEGERSPLHAYHVVRGEAPPVEETAPMRMGARMEDDLAEEYELETGRQVYLPVPRPDSPAALGAGMFLLVSRRFPWLGATPDRLFTLPDPDGGRRLGPRLGVLEMKVAAGPAATAAWKAEIPIAPRVQAAVQREVSLVSLASAAGWVGGLELAWGDLPPRDEPLEREFVALMLGGLEDFARRCREERPPDAGAGDVALVRKLLGPARGRRRIKLARPFDDLGDEWRLAQQKHEKAKAALAEAESEKARVEARVRVALGEADEGLLPSGRVFWRAQRTVEEKKVRAPYVRHEFGLRDRY